MLALTNNQLLQTNLFKPYLPNDFNSALHIKEAMDHNVENALTCLRELVTKYNFNCLIGICRVHNHFKLSKNEIVLTKLHHKGSAVCNNEHVLHLQAVTYSEPENLLPYMWAYDKKSKKFFALQFFDNENEQMQERLREFVKEVSKHPSFCQEVIEILERFDMQDKLGIYITYDVLLEEAKRQINGDTSFQEITNEVKREQWIYAEPREKVQQKREKCPNEVVTTLWSFNSENNENTWCISCNICHHCNHCDSHGWNTNNDMKN